MCNPPVIDPGTGFSAHAATVWVSRRAQLGSAVCRIAQWREDLPLIVERAGKIVPDGTHCPLRVSQAVFNQPFIARRAEILRLVVASIMLMPLPRLQSAPDVVVERSRAAVQRVAYCVSPTQSSSYR